MKFMAMLVRRWINEPLFHFLVLAILVFAVYQWINRNSGNEVPDKIVITQGKIENLATTFAKSWHRPPTQQELDGLIREFVHEEVCVREAQALGLDRDDTVIRRRLRQKMEFLFEDIAAQVEPSDRDLQTYLNSHPDQFKKEGSYTFSQVYLNPEKHGSHLQSDAKVLLDQLHKNTSVDLEMVGDSFLVPRVFDSVSAQDVKSQFGDNFAAKLDKIPVGRWEGPIESGLGMHLVLITQRTEEKVASLDEVRNDVKREWANAKRLEMNEKVFSEMLRRYTVEIQPAPKNKSANDQLAEVRK